MVSGVLYLYLVVLPFIVGGLAFAGLYLLARRLRREAPRPELGTGDPFVGDERCASCGAWQARHLTRAVCWQCRTPIVRVVEAQSVGER